MLQKVIFLDRDGVINRDSSNYVKNKSEFAFLPGSKTALKQLTLNGFTLFIITNQSIINRKIVTMSVVNDIHKKMKTAIEAEGGIIKDIFLCPHTPEESCECRKPKPGLIHEAKIAYEIDLKTSFMVGDSAKDIECGKNAGCRFTVLVKTGSGMIAQKTTWENNLKPNHVAKDLNAAARWIIDTYNTLNLAR